MLKKRKWLIGVSILVVLLAGGFFLFYFDFTNTEDFTKTSLIRMNIPLNGELNTTVKIFNSEEDMRTISFSLSNFDNLAVLSDSEFVLQSEESKNLIISFIDSKHVPGVYVGKLIIESSVSREEIPVVLGVEDPNHAFAIIQSSLPKYDTVYSGDKFGMDIKVYDLINSNVQTVKSSYIIKNLNDEVMLSGNTDLIVGTDGKTELISIPKEWGEGDYVFISYIDYKNTTSFSSYLFYVSDFKKSNFVSNNVELLLIVVVLFIVIILGLVIYFVSARDSLLIQLKAQQSQEIRRNLKCIDYSRRVIEKSKVKPEKKKEKLKKLVEIKKDIVKKLKEKQKKQKKEISHLRKIKTKGDILKKKLNHWKKEGYKMYEVDKGVKKVTNKGIASQVKEWNKQGYDTSFLNK